MKTKVFYVNFYEHKGVIVIVEVNQFGIIERKGVLTLAEPTSLQEGDEVIVKWGNKYTTPKGKILHECSVLSRAEAQ